VNDFKLKIILSILGGVIFSFIFILLAFALPTKQKEVHQTKHLKKPKNRLESISQSLNK